MGSLKELRRRYQEEALTLAKSAKSANFQNSDPKFSQFSRLQQKDDILELQFQRDERAAIREYDGGMARERAEYFSLLDVPILPNKYNG
tara:strand:- start:81 stop:347 length:267 start_codon:yes stop_codon:yes gene_type:complete